MSLNKKILIIFGVLFFGTLLFVPYVNASIPTECNVNINWGSITIQGNVCKKVAPGETESFHLYSTIFSIKNNAQVNYFIPYLAESERHAFLNSAIANPSLEVIPNVGSMCFKRCADEGKTCSTNMQNMVYVFYASKNLIYNSNTGLYTFTVSNDASRTRYAYTLVGSSVLCQNSVFGDPRPGEKKFCFYPVTCPGATPEEPSSGGSSSGSSGGGSQTPPSCPMGTSNCGMDCCGAGQTCYQNSCCTPTVVDSSTVSCGSEYLGGDGCGGSYSGVGSYCSDGYSCTTVGCLKPPTLNR
jgi:hypothetical protein